MDRGIIVVGVEMLPARDMVDEARHAVAGVNTSASMSSSLNTPGTD
jgi:hypothetical protein